MPVQLAASVSPEAWQDLTGALDHAHKTHWASRLIGVVSWVSVVACCASLALVINLRSAGIVPWSAVVGAPLGLALGLGWVRHQMGLSIDNQLAAVVAEHASRDTWAGGLRFQRVQRDHGRPRRREAGTESGGARCEAHIKRRGVVVTWPPRGYNLVVAKHKYTQTMEQPTTVACEAPTNGPQSFG
mmetsp:Transcript_28022/g.72449  ORF Transcript_28022/g.72449 Transcript_28022/m.72449 type:complete len:186 (-) Transcript_28022:172-729(-)